MPQKGTEAPYHGLPAHKSSTDAPAIWNSLNWSKISPVSVTLSYFWLTFLFAIMVINNGKQTNTAWRTSSKCQENIIVNR